MIEASVIVLCWNHENYIEKSLRSLEQQTFRNFEIVFLDNCSTDKSYLLAQEILQELNIPYKLFRNEKPQGICKNINFLVEHASAEYIIPFSTDDWLSETHVEDKVEGMRQHPEVGVLYTSGWIYDERKKTTTVVDTTNFKTGDISKEIIYGGDIMFYVSVCHRKSILQEIGGYDESLLIDDLDLLIRIAKKYPFYFLNKPSYYLRYSGASTTSNVDFMVKGWEQYYQKYKHETIWNMKEWMAEKYRSYAAVSIDRNDTTKAWELFKKSLVLYPWNKKLFQTFIYYVRKRVNKTVTAE